MIYAKVINKKDTHAGNEMLLIHFYGGVKADLYINDIKTWKLHPYSFLAAKNFKPITDSFFYKE